VLDPTDAAAEQRVVRHLRDVLPDHVVATDADGEFEVDVARDEVATLVARAFSVHFERRPGQRRLVLTGEWEVDPAAVADGRKP
jgi:uncharacterized protein YmfQ (DUF2313 family)